MKNLLVISVLMFLYQCKSASHISLEKSTDSNLPKSEIAIREHSIQSVLWQQNAAEYKALCHQAFNVAKKHLDDSIDEGPSHGKPLAIILGIDETVLDNSAFNAKMIDADQEYSKQNWIEWGKLLKAKPIPGVLKFIKYADSKGINLFYISNRYEIQIDETMENMKSLGFPSIRKDRIILRSGTGGKQERRKKVLSKFEVFMFIGDNLSDFSDAFDKKSTVERNQNMEKIKNDFGTKFIILPNPMYGDWESNGIYEGNFSWKQMQKDSIRRSKLRSY